MNTRLVIGPNASLSVQDAWAVMAFMSLLGLGIAGLFALRGYWPILPFAGLELAALGAALWVSVRRNRYREVIRFEDARIRLEFGLVGRGVLTAIEWPRAWTRVSLRRDESRQGPTVLALDYAGQRVAIGRCLTDAERERLAARLRELLRPGWRGAGEHDEGNVLKGSGRV